MLYNLITLFILFIFAVGQTSLTGGIFPLGTSPDLLLVLSIFWVVYFGRKRKMFWILGAGLFLDLATGEPLGKNIFLLALSAYAASYASLKLLMPGELGKFFLTLAFIAGGTLLNEILGRMLSLFVLNDGWEINLLLGTESFFKIIFNLFFFVLIYFPLLKLEKTFFIQKEEIKI